MKSAELLHNIDVLTKVKEVELSNGGYINPEVLAMHEILPTLSPRWAEFVKRRMVFDLVHFSEQRIGEAELQHWQAIKAEVQDYLPNVPQDIGSLPSGWKRVFADVMCLYGDPHGK